MPFALKGEMNERHLQLGAVLRSEPEGTITSASDVSPLLTITRFFFFWFLLTGAMHMNSVHSSQRVPKKWFSREEWPAYVQEIETIPEYEDS